MSGNPTNQDLETVAPSPGTIQPLLLSNLKRQAAPMQHWSKRLYILLALSPFLAFSLPVEAQQPRRTLLLDVITTTSDIYRTETLVYLRVYSDGSAEAHPTHEVDFRSLALKQAQIPAPEMARLRELLSSSKIRALNDEYDRNWGAVDFFTKMEITVTQEQTHKTITLVNFQPFLARRKKQAYPTEIEKLGCIIWELRRNVFKEPPDKDYVRGCQEWGY
jgi:hypothetical protein